MFLLDGMKACLDPAVTLTASELCIFKTEKSQRKTHNQLSHNCGMIRTTSFYFWREPRR